MRTGQVVQRCSQSRAGQAQQAAAQRGRHQLPCRAVQPLASLHQGLCTYGISDELARHRRGRLRAFSQAQRPLLQQPAAAVSSTPAAAPGAGCRAAASPPAKAPHGARASACRRRALDSRSPPPPAAAEVRPALKGGGPQVAQRALLFKPLGARDDGVAARDQARLSSRVSQAG